MASDAPSTSADGLLSRLVNVERGEAAALVTSFVHFFAVLCAYYIIRPVRDEMGVAIGQDGLKNLFVVVFLVMLAAVPVFGWVVSRFQRKHIVPLVYGFFVACLIGFWMRAGAGQPSVLVASAFFVWASVFNLFVVSVFWSLMSDVWSEGQAKRLYGFIAAGGSAGALAGPVLTRNLVSVMGPANLLLVSAAFLLLATAASLVLRKLLADGRAAIGHGDHKAADAMGDGLFAGAVRVWQSPLLFRIALWVLLANLIGTLFYLEQSRIVGETMTDRAQRVQLFATLDLVVNVTTLAAQLLVVSRLIERFGVMMGALALPVWATLGLVALMISPTLGVVVVIMAGERIIAFALSNPALRVLWTTVVPEEKYKAQNFIDTVVYRGGDAASGWLFSALAKAFGLGFGGLAMVALPAAALWIAVSARFSGGQK